MSCEQQVLVLAKSCINKSAPEITHALSKVGGGSMAVGINRLVEIGCNYGLRYGFEIGKRTGRVEGAIMTGGTVIVLFLGYNLLKRCHISEKEEATPTTDSEESEICRSEVPDEQSLSDSEDGSDEPELDQNQISD